LLPGALAKIMLNALLEKDHNWGDISIVFLVILYKTYAKSPA
jgi:hypothetical protein